MTSQFEKMLPESPNHIILMDLFVEFGRRQNKSVPARPSPISSSTSASTLVLTTDSFVFLPDGWEVPDDPIQLLPVPPVVAAMSMDRKLEEEEPTGEPSTTTTTTTSTAPPSNSAPPPPNSAPPTITTTDTSQPTTKKSTTEKKRTLKPSPTMTTSSPTKGTESDGNTPPYDTGSLRKTKKTSTYKAKVEERKAKRRSMPIFIQPERSQTSPKKQKKLEPPAGGTLTRNSVPASNPTSGNSTTGGSMSQATGAATLQTLAEMAASLDSIPPPSDLPPPSSRQKISTQTEPEKKKKKKN